MRHFPKYTVKEQKKITALEEEVEVLRNMVKELSTVQDKLVDAVNLITNILKE